MIWRKFSWKIILFFLQICKWLLPILCRAADKQSEEYPVSLMEKKLQLSRIYREVLDVIDPGISKVNYF